MTTMHRPTTLADAVNLLSSLDDVMVYGGGTAIQILRKQGILFTDNFIDISKIPALREVRIDDAGVVVGAMVSVREMETNPRIQRAVPLVSHAYSHVANPRVRNTASVGGNIAHGDYRLDPPTGLLVLGATVLIASRDGAREVPIRDFFVDFQQTDVGPHEIITGIRIPAQPANAPGSFVKFSSLGVNDWPCASAAAMLVDDGQHAQLRLGLGALAPTSLYLSYAVDLSMSEQDVVDTAIDIANSAMEPIADVRGQVEYKARMGRMVVEEAVRNVMKERQHV